MEFIYTLSEIEKVAQHIVEAAKDEKTILFYGKMGVGKTTLIKNIVHILGSEDTVSSPTFSLVNEYQGRDVKIYHFDFYRIETEEEVFDIGFEEYLAEDAWKLIEWPSKISGELPKKAIKIFISLKNRDKRKISLNLA